MLVHSWDKSHQFASFPRTAAAKHNYSDATRPKSPSMEGIIIGTDCFLERMAIQHLREGQEKILEGVLVGARSLQQSA